MAKTHEQINQTQPFIAMCWLAKHKPDTQTCIAPNQLAVNQLLFLRVMMV